MKAFSPVGARLLWIVLVSWVAAGVSQPGIALAQPFSPYAVFEAMSLTDLQTLQVQLTPHPLASEGIVVPVTFTSTSNTIDLSLFDPFRRPELDYSDVSGTTFKATPTALKAIIDNVGTLPNVTAGGLDANAVMSFTLVNGNIGFDAALNSSDANDLFQQLRLSLASNMDGVVALQSLGCEFDLVEAGQPSDVTLSVTVQLMGVRLDREAGLFVGGASVMNNSGLSIPGPISLVLALSAGVSLANLDGITCVTSPGGVAFLNISDSALAPGAEVLGIIEYDNPDRLEISTPLVKVLAGPGAR